MNSARPYLIIWSVLAVIVWLMIQRIDNARQIHVDLLQNDLMHEAHAHFDNMVMTRSWNASHGGVYVKQKEGIDPNPYLKNNQLKSDKNETLIKINPAWMTRQISEISNKLTHHYYKITSLKPINPANIPDAFEKEALEYFETHRDEPYYVRFEETAGVGNTKFNFMGSLKVTKNCLPCHAHQGYVVGDIRGGIRVSIPTDSYEKAVSFVEKRSFYMKITVIVISLLFGFVLSLFVRNTSRHQVMLKLLNQKLERKVALRTEELSDLNAKLEEKVKEEVAKNSQKEHAMLAQSRHAAMGEMIGMLAHQWRQPIAIVEMGINNILIDIELGDDDKEVIKKDLMAIAEQTQHLSNTISEFSSNFREDADPVETEPAVVMAKVLEVMKSSLEFHNITVHIDCHCVKTLTIFPQKLFQTYMTLLTNAKEVLIARKVDDAVVKVTIEDDEKGIVTRICDNAGGIKAESIEQIFEPYYSTKTDKDGTGLGLYIARILVQKQLQGTLTAENSDEGACFTVFLPV